MNEVGIIMVSTSTLERESQPITMAAMIPVKMGECIYPLSALNLGMDALRAPGMGVILNCNRPAYSIRPVDLEQNCHICGQDILAYYPGFLDLVPLLITIRSNKTHPEVLDMDLQLVDKVALVTAASKGLGKASARQLAREGAHVVMCARSDTLEQSASEIRGESSSEVVPVRADVTVQVDIERLVQRTVDQFGRIDILVINAGGPTPGNFLDLTLADWEDGIQLTLMSAVRLCYEVVPHMLEQGSGNIIAIESISVRQPIDKLILSNSVRMAVIGMLKSMANEFGPKGIRINAINPTFTWTERVEQLLKNRAADKGTDVAQEADAIAATIPLRRMGDVEEFGRAVAWLASPASSYIHGHGLMFDGGATRSSI